MAHRPPPTHPRPPYNPGFQHHQQLYFTQAISSLVTSPLNKAASTITNCLQGNIEKLGEAQQEVRRAIEQAAQRSDEATKEALEEQTKTTVERIGHLLLEQQRAIESLLRQRGGESGQEHAHLHDPGFREPGGSDEGRCTACRLGEPPGSEDSAEVGWVSCDVCMSWTHWSCVSFQCAACQKAPE